MYNLINLLIQPRIIAKVIIITDSGHSRVTER